MTAGLQNVYERINLDPEHLCFHAYDFAGYIVLWDLLNRLDIADRDIATNDTQVNVCDILGRVLGHVLAVLTAGCPGLLEDLLNSFYSEIWLVFEHFHVGAHLSFLDDVDVV